MLRVYGLTFDHTINYGSCFQAYALQTAIENMTIQGEHPSYFLIPQAEFKDFPAPANQNFITSIKRKIRRHLFLNFRKKFMSFEKKFMKFANCQRIKELPFLNETADAFVCGSDVIWNPSFNGRNGLFYLDFATKYKFSYAASFGKTEIEKEDLAFAREKLTSFNYISVREKTSLDIAKECIDRDVEVVADPVVLLDTEEWKKAMVKMANKNKYIFVYKTHLTSTFERFVKTLGKQTGLQVIVSVWNVNSWQLFKQGGFSILSPEEWLSLLQQAEYVVTNSFHATVFSVLFHKKFYTVVDGDKAKGGNMRMNDFLNTIGLGDRMYSSVPDVIDCSETNYVTADARIASMRAESLAYLRKNLEEAYKQKN